MSSFFLKNKTFINGTILNSIYFYTEYTTLTVGILFNLISIVIFNKIIKNEQQNRGHLYKYFLIKSFADLGVLAVSLPEMFYFPLNSPDSNDSYGMQIWYIYFYYYFFNIFAYLSSFCEAAASFDCLMLVYGKYTFYKSKCFFVCSIGGVFGFSLIFLAPIVFLFKIDLNEESRSYSIKYMEYKNNFHLIYRIVYYSVRDLIPLIVLFIFNTSILVILKRITTSRQQVLTSADPSIRRSRSAEKNKLKMILFTSLSYTFHFPILIVYTGIVPLPLTVFFVRFFNFLLLLPYVVSFFSYISFNTHFRRYFYRILSMKCFDLDN
jgi:hypothetical protein